MVCYYRDLCIIRDIRIVQKGRGAGRMTRKGLQKHRGKLIASSIILTTLVTTGVCTILFIKRWLYKQQLKITEQHFVKEQIKRRFHQTQQDSLYTMYELVPVLTLVLNKDLDLDQIVETLKGKKLTKKLAQGVPKDSSELDEMGSVVDQPSDSSNSGVSKSKAELWEELKVQSLVKLLTVVYATCMLLLLTRLQLNILARREYLDTAIKIAVDKEGQKGSSIIMTWLNSFWNYGSNALSVSTPPNIENSSEEEDKASSGRNGNKSKDKARYANEQAFLSLSWWLLNRGWLRFKPLVQQQVSAHFGDLSPRDMLTFEEFGGKLSKTIYNINKELFDNHSHNLLVKCFLPEPHLEQFVLQQTLDSDTLRIINEDNTMLRQLVQETFKCSESSASLIVLESLVNESFQFVMQQVEAKVTKKSKKSSQTPSNGAAEAAGEAMAAAAPKFQVALFSIGLKECCQDMLKNGLISMNNEFLQSLDSVPELDDLSASVYSNFGF
ncbi:Pex3p Ecym_8161 [Eremothecium cymbalariae DBVPG|uniref:Peroxin-3 n=1 Tax=Eremothecium cymbalariae (strain CBS 270.75 / DBVPG 7215 / KCTC 17166 / NRRL Y-17582) TaxID=931890 RepID=G8JX74_ERECY|nr:Hypothetical protein Ecym_8161 [Eremothecium cymbalariae DBVPG\